MLFVFLSLGFPDFEDPSIFLKMSRFHFSSGLNGTLLCVCPTASLLIHLLMDTKAGSPFLLLEMGCGCAGVSGGGHGGLWAEARAWESWVIWQF